MREHKSEWEHRIFVNFLDTKSGHAVPPEHYHGVYEIAFFVKARAQICVRDIKYDIRDGDVLIVNPFDVHGVCNHPQVHFTRYGIFFNIKTIQNVLVAVHQSELLDQLERHACRKVSLDLKTRNRLELICQEIIRDANGHPDGESAVQLNVAMLLVRLKALMDNQKYTYKHPKKDRKVHRLIEFIDEHYKQPLHLDEMEDAVGINKYYMSHLFKETTGFTLIEYVHHRRVVEAQKLLMQTDKPVIDICFECGFQSLQHFGRIFKKVSSMTPTQYRNIK